ncbi:S8 family peptidase [Paenibacillus dakarensis]|uniref:S8 family peptidase n=1 Tax=Paenibacillus dakarensis TaxID=1527293 RepID=UPI0006D59F81|nr:S8 family peptidase [Paenibacillus dakarensis]
MKSRHLWTILGTAGVLGLFVIFLLTPDPNLPEQAVGPQTKKAPPKEEHRFKQTTLTGDLNATDHFSRMDAKQHLQLILEHDKHQQPEQVNQQVKDHQRTHDHFEKFIWYDLRNNKESAVNIKKTAAWTVQEKQQIDRYFKSARQSLKHGKSYESPKFKAADQLYFITAELSKDQKYGAAALINLKVLKEVTNHQKRNLRMIPYPKEGKFKVESVHSDTLRDITVKTGHDNEHASHFYENEIVVRFTKEPTELELKQISKEISCDAPRKLGYAYVFRSNRMDYKSLQTYFSQKWSTKYAEPHFMYLTNESSDPVTDNVNIPNDLLFSKYQWNLPAIETNKGWNLSRGSQDVVIAVVDTGVDLHHTDLNGQLVPGYNVVNPDKEPDDDVGHGTHVAGIIGALVNNGEGVAGVSWYNKIMPVKALDSSGSGTTYAVAEGIIWATDHGAKVINMSLGNYADSQFLHDAVRYAYDRDVILVAASGNDNTERPGYPAAYPEVLAVGATNQDMSRADYSNYGDYIDVTAPGTNIASTYPGNQYAALSGTSMASPHAAAMAGLIRSLNPELSNREVMDLMISQAVDLGDKGKDKYYGSGQVDVFRALQAAGNQSRPLQLWPQRVLQRLYQEIQRNNISSSTHNR